MQFGLLGMLLNLPGGALTGGQGQGGGQGGLADMFAALLGDSGQQGGGQYGTQGGQLPRDIAASALAAQEVTDAGAAKPGEGLDALTDLLNQEISAEDAAALLEQFDQLQADLGQQGEAGEQPLLQEIKAALTEIKDGKQPQQTVGAVLQSLPTVQQAASEKQAPAVERVLAWMRGALQTKTKEAPTQEATAEDAVDPTESPLVQSLQASLFRDANPAEAPAQAQEEGTSREYIEVVPLSFTTQTAAPAWVQQLTAARDIAIDTEIPGLALPADTAEPVLPEVNLPEVDLAAEGELPEVNLPQAAAPEDKVTDLAKFRATLENGVAAQSVDPAPKDEQPVVSNLQAAATHGVAAASDHRGAIGIALPHGVANHAPVTEQVHVAVQRATKEGIDQLTLQLEPADLGRVEVKMQTGADGQTQLSFVVDKAETLDSLARDARSLERMLQDAGVKADAGNMQFNLRQQAQGGEQGGQDGQGQRHAQWGGNEEGSSQTVAAAATQNYTLTLRDGVDIRV